MKLSIRWKIILFIILPVVIIYSGFMIYHIVQMRRWAVNNFERQILDMAREHAGRFDGELQKAAQTATFLSTYVEKNPHLHSDQLIDLLEAGLEKNPLFFGIAVAYAPYAYDPDKKLFIRYLHREKEKTVLTGFVFQGYDYTDSRHEYWNKPRLTGKASWTDPYYDEGGGNALMSTYSVPFFNKGQFMGIALVDIPLKPIRELTVKDLPGNVKLAIISQNGRFVYSSNPDRINLDVSEIWGEPSEKELSAFSEKMVSGETGVARLSKFEFNEPELVAYAPVPSTGWGFSVSMTEKEALAEIQRLFYGDILFFLASLLVLIPGLWFFSSRLSRSIVYLNKTVMEFSKGKMDERSGLKSNDEIGALAAAFNHMASQLTEREKKLLDTRRLFEAVITQSPIPLIVVDSKGGIQIFNDAVLKITGMNKKAGIEPGMKLMKLQPTWKDYDAEGNRILPENSPLVAAMGGKTTKGLEFKIVQEDGTEKWAIAYGVPVKDDQGRIIAGFAAFPEITERKKAEEELRESEERFRRIAENAKDVIFRMSIPDGKCEYISPATMETFGYEPREFYDTPFMIRKIIHPEWVIFFDISWSNLQKGITPPNFEYPVFHKSNTTRWMHQRSVLVKSSSGEPVAIEGIVTDVTQTRLAAEEKARLEEDLRQAHKMEAVGTLAGGIAHDFNNILSAIIGFSELAKDDIPESSPAREEIEEVINAGKRARDLVKQILAFSRKSTGNQVPVQIRSIIADALNLLRAGIPSTIEIRQQLDPSCGLIQADPTQIHQVIMNLGTNAAHAMDENGGLLEVFLNEAEIEDTPETGSRTYVVLTVKDTGRGIKKHILNRIFDPYFTTKPYGKGSGMGLAVVHGIVESHHGKITVDSTPGKGTVFQVFFPKTTAVIEEESSDMEKLPTGNERILLVDDEKSAARMTRERLERLGYKVTLKTDSLEALELFRSNPDFFDLVITDQTMPKMTGEQLAQIFLGIRKDLPIILYTGYSSKIDRKKSNEIGIKAFLMKPVDKGELAGTIRAVLEDV